MNNDVVIIGGGVAGLGCARTLQNAGVPFTLITKEIGGRIIESANHAVNYGAYYVTTDYHHVAALVKRGRRISLLNFQFHHSEQAYSMFSLRAIKYLSQWLRLRHQLHIFREHLRQFRRNATTEEQSVLLQQNQYLWKLIHQPATDFVQTHQLTGLFRDYISEALSATDFVSLPELQAFDMLWLTQPLITPTYEYSFDPAKIMAPFHTSILLDEVTTVIKQGDQYAITTVHHGTQTYRFVVVAVATTQMQRLLHTADGKGPVNAYMYHLQGQIKPAYAKLRYNVFDDTNRLVIIAGQSDGTYLVYTRTPFTDFSELFSDYQMITAKVWNPAFNVAGSNLVKQNRGQNLYVAGEHNLCTLEDSYITGVYAAKQIIKNISAPIAQRTARSNRPY